MSALDSRALTYLDCYGQRFDSPGTIRYAVGGPLASCLHVDDLAFTVEVEQSKGGEPRQHDVTIQHNGRAFSASPAMLRIATGDVVLWHAHDSSSPPYAVWGEGAGGTFSSTSLRSGALYTHAIGTAGEIEWADARRAAVRGRIRVRDLDSRDPEACERWSSLLREGAVVVINADRADPAELDLISGQTVFFAVIGGDGISITDTAVLINARPPDKW
ncbi:hypothetical protein [Frankia sp. Cas4]|uniref:hypothetical protein n=1 Tax=Frankia sp. Cas4 TaxID=3073927 RepID=UPI002AD34A9D|nr:hypothetical protein [Frankia sp. Cas4]